jgi:hypothetical protein
MWMCRTGADGWRVAPIRQLALAHVVKAARVVMAARVTECGVIKGGGASGGGGRAKCLG